MDPEIEVVVRSTPDAPWLPPGGRADVVRSEVAPRPAGLVRLLLRRGDAVFCLPRDETGLLDLPTRAVAVDDVDGSRAAAALAQQVVGAPGPLVPVGFVRNVVAPGHDDYGWPVPVAHFVVWAADGEPVVDGTWVDACGATSPLAGRHWFPLLPALG